MGDHSGQVYPPPHSFDVLWKSVFTQIRLTKVHIEFFHDTSSLMHYIMHRCFQGKIIGRISDSKFQGLF